MHSLALVALAVHTLFLVPLFPQACYAIPQDVQTTTSATGALPSSTIVTSASSALPVTSDTSSARGTASSSADASQTTASPMTTPATPQLPLSTLKEIWTIQSRRVDAIIGALDSPSQVPQWAQTLGANGRWPDSEVDYTTACDARRANWPAQDHWLRLRLMAAAWHGGLKDSDQFVKDPQLREFVSTGMQYWFARDFTNPNCLYKGGTALCPCTNTEGSLWNTNWFSNTILIPKLVIQTCLLLNDTLLATELGNCTHFASRSYATVGGLTGANTLDVSQLGIDQALLTVDPGLLADGYSNARSELRVVSGIKVDGILSDGAFGQHAGVLYNGNYGKDFTNTLLSVEIGAAGTSYAATQAARSAFETLFNGDKWMIFLNSLTKVLHWDFSVLGRFISFPVADYQATGGIKINLTQVEELGNAWSSTTLKDFATTLATSGDNANAGELVGNRMFYTSDYMVHRGWNYVSTVKMYSTRTLSSECVNTQNPLGFHLSDGAVYTYVKGDEYEDISAAWDWNRIPGITTDYGASPLACTTTERTGLESFVGGVSESRVGLAAMRYTNPVTKAFGFQKVWFFFEDDLQHVMISRIFSNTTAPVYSVLDQKRRNGAVIIDGDSHNSSVAGVGAQSIWHSNVGYTFSNLGEGAALHVETGEKTGTWPTIGTSTQPPATADLFSAWIYHSNISTPLSYTAFPGVSYRQFISKAQRTKLQSIRNDGVGSAIYSPGCDTAMFVFWDVGGGSATFKPRHDSHPVTISVNANIGVIYRLGTHQLTVADPSQTLFSVVVTVNHGTKNQTINFALPSDNLAGSSVTKTVFV